MKKLPRGIVQLHDYIYILRSLKENGEKMKDEYDGSILTKFYKLKETTSKFWILRGATPAFPKPAVNDAFDAAYEIFYAVMRKYMLEADIGKRILATVVADIDFFKSNGPCVFGRMHRQNLLGFILTMLLKTKNCREAIKKNVSSHYTGPCCKYPEIYPAPAEDNILLDMMQKIKSIRTSNCRIYA
uniref:Uncharacterized protein n=1 Tax=Glossina palpalis gambiensis TaxID=67801 RepID=A0A1B0BXB5_9MUSC